MGATILGFDISVCSTKFNFVDKFDVRMEDIIGEDDTDENHYYYEPYAVLTSRPDSQGGQLFFYNRSQSNWHAVNCKEHVISG